MAEIYWLEQTQADLPETNHWLGPSELSVLNSLMFLKRRTDWRLGRWTAKCAFALMHRIPIIPEVLAQIEIHAAASGAPQLFILARPEPVTISISHRSESAICAITTSKIPMGCDLEQIEPHTAGFLEDYFTPAEQLLISRAPIQDHPLLTTLLWSAKESALKAMQLGLRADTRSVVVELSPRNRAMLWNPLRVSSHAGDLFRGWWWEASGMIRTIVAAPGGDAPICLSTGGGRIHSSSFQADEKRVPSLASA